MVGLGNWGAEYARTRHNVGFLCVDRLAARHALSFASGGRDVRGARLADTMIEGTRLVLAKPRGFMNTCGPAVRRLVEAHRLKPEQLLVVCDDLDLPLGRLRLRRGGSAGGHHGLESIINSLGTQDFPRLRLGIGRPARRAEVVDYVLSDFTPEEREALDAVLEAAAQAAEAVALEGVEAAMNRFNQFRLPGQ